MTKRNAIISVISIILLSILVYYVAVQEKENTENINENNSQQIAIDCAQCEYLPEGNTQNECFQSYNCK